MCLCESVPCLWMPEPEVLDLLKHVGGHWELNVGPQEEQCIFLTSELPLQPRHVSAAKPLFT